MGQFEKIVVLVVLFAITVILVVSLSTTDEAVGQAHPLSSTAAAPARQALLEQAQPAETRTGTPVEQLPLGTERAPRPVTFAFDEPAPLAADRDRLQVSAAEVAEGIAAAGEELEPAPAPASTPRPRDDRPRLLLSTEVEDPSSTAGLPAGTLLRTSADLEPTPHADLMSYTWRSGDSLESIAARLYGSSARSALLRQANEGRRVIRPGEAIFVPVFDVTRQEPERPVARTLLPPTGEAAVYQVQEGETLWAIAKKHYGTGVRWNDIFEANQDLLRDPDAVRAGMRLRIP